MAIVTFSFPFVHGQGRPRFGKGHTYKAKKDVECERKIRDAYRGACIREFGHVLKAPDNVPVTVSVVSARALPKSKPKRILREFDLGKPDASNILKAVEDALNGVAYGDDSQVTETHVFKRDRIRGCTNRTFVTVHWEEVSDG